MKDLIDLCLLSCLGGIFIPLGGIFPRLGGIFRSLGGIP